MAKKYLSVRPEILKKADDEWNKINTTDTRILGVFLRGTDYIALKPEGHPIQPDADIAVRDAYRIMIEHSCNKLFLVTEDSSIITTFKKSFRNELVVYESGFEDYHGGKLSEYYTKDRYTKGEEYLIKVILLSRCHCILAGRASGSVGAMLLSDGFEYSKIYDLGVY